MLGCHYYWKSTSCKEKKVDTDFQRQKMIAHQKSKGKRELLNLHSSINYDDAKDPSRSKKGKAQMM
jgi:hypothetical protein